MNAKKKLVLMLLVAGALACGILLFKARSGPGLDVLFRLAVTPREQSEFVIEQATSARFKYMLGKQSGAGPVLAQKLRVRALPNSSLLEARIRVKTQEEARRYVEVFVPTLQSLCRGRAQVSLEKDHPDRPDRSDAPLSGL